MPVVIKYFLLFSRSQKYATRLLRSLLSYFYDLSNLRKYFFLHYPCHFLTTVWQIPRQFLFSPLVPVWKTRVLRVFHTGTSAENIFHTETSAGNIFHTESSAENIFHIVILDFTLSSNSEPPNNLDYMSC